MIYIIYILYIYLTTIFIFLYANCDYLNFIILNYLLYFIILK